MAVRRLDAPELRDQLADTAVSAGLDLYHTWGDRAYFLDSRFIASRIEGAAAGIRTIAHNPVHYFQRPDAEHLPDDPEATALTGTGGRIALGRSNRGRWRYSGTFDWRTPDVSGAELERKDLYYNLQLIVELHDVWRRHLKAPGYFTEKIAKGAVQAKMRGEAPAAGEGEEINVDELDLSDLGGG